ncbi:MAG: protein kinase [Phycisphaerales bacterium]|nr:protein kinase [Phycisphaerales bacterium]
MDAGSTAMSDENTGHGSFDLTQTRDSHATADSLKLRAAGKRQPEIDGYRIVGVLGQGGMGVVYRAVQTKLGRTVALKVLPAMVGSASPAAVSRFQREAMAAARLHHTNIVPIYDFGECADAYYYAMELVVGRPLNVLAERLSALDVTGLPAVRLAELLAGLVQDGDCESDDGGAHAHHGASSARSSTGRSRAYFQQVAKWFADAADALHYAHGQSIVHRDIKPANLILSVDGRIMIADFGLSKSGDDVSMTQTGSLMGTLRYMSPEQAMARRMRVDHRTDIYSLGVTLYELMTFQAAFTGDDEKEILGAVMTRDPPRPHKIMPAVPRELETICLKSIEKSPDARYATARAMAEDLRRFINDLPIEAKSPTLAQRGIKLIRRHKAASVAAALAVVLVSTSLVFYTIRRRETVERYVVTGLTEARAMRWDEASAALGEALHMDPKNVRALHGTAWKWFFQYNQAGATADAAWLENARQYCDLALEVDPRHEASLNLLGVVHKKRGEYDKAIAAYERAIDINPKSFAPWTNLAIVHALSGDLELAERRLKRATEIGGTEDASNVDAWRGLAMIHLFRGRHDDALEAIRTAHDCNKNDLASYAIEARIRMETEPEKADDAAVQADFGGNGDEKASRVRALTSLRGGAYKVAMEKAEQAIKRGDEPAINQLMMARASAETGNVEEARRHWDESVRQWPAALKSMGDFALSADRGVLWIDTYDEYDRLRQEATRAMERSP